MKQQTTCPFSTLLLSTWGNVSLTYYNYIYKFALEHHIFETIKTQVSHLKQQTEGVQ